MLPCVCRAAAQGYLKAAEASDEDMVAALSSIYSNRAIGKELQVDVDTHGPAQISMQEVSMGQQDVGRKGSWQLLFPVCNR